MNRPYKEPEARSKISNRFIPCLIRNVNVRIVGDRVFLDYPNPTKDTVIDIEAQVISRYEWGRLFQ